MCNLIGLVERPGSNRSGGETPRCFILSSQDIPFYIPTGIFSKHSKEKHE